MNHCILRSIRENKGFTRKYVAHTIGVKLRTYVSYESGERNPTLDTASKIAFVLGCTVDDLLGNRDAS
jgi:DNA-binding XRE family transcriptional regulator